MTVNVAILVGFINLCSLRLVLARFKENLGRIGGARDHRGSEDASGQREEAENDFVRASKEKFSGARRVLDENSLFTRVR